MNQFGRKMVDRIRKHATAGISKAALIAALCALAAMRTANVHAADVVVSIKPIHALVAGVMGESGKPRLLLKGASSPHTYQMRPSEARALSKADLIVWIGEAMETFLDRPIANLGSETGLVTLHEAPGMRLLPNREGGIWGDDHQEEHVDEHKDHGHDHGAFNMHLWLHPGNARGMVDVIAEALARIDPAGAETYRANAKAMQKRIAALDSALRTQLAPVRRHAFIVFHDAYQYFELAYDLNSKGSFAVDPARPPGARRLSQLRAALAEHEIRCVFTEPQFEPGLVRTVIEGSRVRTAVLDPLGVDVEPGPDAWFGIMRDLADAIEGCLGEG